MDRNTHNISFLQKEKLKELLSTTSSISWRKKVGTQFFLDNIILIKFFTNKVSNYSDKHVIQILMLESALAETTWKRWCGLIAIFNISINF